MTALDRLIGLVSVSPLGDDRFSGVGSVDDGSTSTYGGHLLAQACSAATATVDGNRALHSFHGYFLRPGRPGQPYVHEVTRVRDGRTFCSRRVRIRHVDDDALLFEATVSFAIPEDGPMANVEQPPDLAGLPAPDTLDTYRDLMARHEESPLPLAWAQRDYGLDLRTINAPWAPAGVSERGGIRMWIKADGVVPNDPGLHRSLLAYQSDESLSDNVAAPFDATWGAPGVVFVSLDHAMWFHRPIDLNQWLLLDQWALTTGGGRGTATGRLWDSSGALVASFTQEALLRIDEEARR